MPVEEKGGKKRAAHGTVAVAAKAAAKRASGAPETQQTFLAVVVVHVETLAEKIMDLNP